MDGQNYLDQISAQNRPVKEKTLNKFLSSKIFWFILGAVILFILLAVLGAILSSNKTDEKTLAYELKLHIDNTAEVVQEYQPSVKSSALRADSASLYGVLSDGGKDLSEYLVNKYNVKEKDIGKNLADEANTEKDALKDELFKAKINGILDRVFAQKMSYEISMILAEEAKIINSTKNETLKNLLTNSHDSLSVLYNNFNDFSETK